MQINLYNKSVKNVFLYLGWILLFIVLWFKGCSNGQKLSNDKVIIKEVTKTLPADTIVKHEVISVKDRTNEKKLTKDIIELHSRLQNYQEEVEWMQDEFSYKDSTQKAELYRLATQLKSFESNFEDENLKLTINGIIAANEVKEITPTYTIKKKEIPITQKEVKFRMLGGVGLGNTPQFDKPIFNANIGFQNRKGNIIRVGYDTEQRVLIGYDFSIFKVEK